MAQACRASRVDREPAAAASRRLRRRMILIGKPLYDEDHPRSGCGNGPTYDYAIGSSKHPAQAQSVEVGPGGIRVDPDRPVGIITATFEITAADVGAEQSTRPERARVVASCVKEGNGVQRLASEPPCSGR